MREVRRSSFLCLGFELFVSLPVPATPCCSIIHPSAPTTHLDAGLLLLLCISSHPLPSTPPTRSSLTPALRRFAHVSPTRFSVRRRLIDWLAGRPIAVQCSAVSSRCSSPLLVSFARHHAQRELFPFARRLADRLAPHAGARRMGDGRARPLRLAVAARRRRPLRPARRTAAGRGAARRSVRHDERARKGGRGERQQRADRIGSDRLPSACCTLCSQSPRC